MPPGVPYLQRISIIPERLPEHPVFPFHLPFIARLNLEFRSRVTFFVGENGTGKSTLLEAIADLCRLPVSGGSRNELEAKHGPEEESQLARILRPIFRARPLDGYFLRAEFHSYFASLLEQRKADPDYYGDPYRAYGGKSLHEQSHGESFLAVLQNRLEDGMFLLDEPESALSPQRQLALLSLIYDLVQAGQSQFVIASHSPILMTYPGADIISFDENPPRRITLQETSHFRVTKGILEQPDRYWKHLTD